eukprot:scaffold76665_cov15-Prasinocladus_malaysianus.AAC.1
MLTFRSTFSQPCVDLRISKRATTSSDGSVSFAPNLICLHLSRRVGSMSSAAYHVLFSPIEHQQPSIANCTESGWKAAQPGAVANDHGVF